MLLPLVQRVLRPLLLHVLKQAPEEPELLRLAPLDLLLLVPVLGLRVMQTLRRLLLPVLHLLVQVPRRLLLVLKQAPEELMLLRSLSTRRLLLLLLLPLSSV